MRKTASPKNKQVIKGLKLVHLNYANSDCQSTNFEYSHLLAFGPRPWRPRRSLLKICLDSDACFIDALPAKLRLLNSETASVPRDEGLLISAAPSRPESRR